MFLEVVPESNIFQTPEMRDVFASTKNYEPKIIAMEHDGEIIDLVLGCIIKEGGGLKGSFSSRAIVTGGPLSRRADLTQLMRAFDEEVGPKSLYAQIRNLRDMSSSRRTLEGLGYEFEEHLNYVHNLTKPRSEIWEGFSEGRRKGIKKAESRGLKLVEGGKEEIDDFYDMVSMTYKEAGIPLADKSLFASAWRFLEPRGMVHLFLVVHEERTLAGRMILAYNGILHDWYAGSVSTAKAQNASEFLVWSIMKWGSDNGFRHFDFGGAGRLGEKYGPGEFKRRFGGTLTNFGRFQKVYHPMKHFVGRKGYEVLRRIG
jgi:serine/alanine adding enzyme